MAAVSVQHSVRSMGAGYTGMGLGLYGALPYGKGVESGPQRAVFACWGENRGPQRAVFAWWGEKMAALSYSRPHHSNRRNTLVCQSHANSKHPLVDPFTACVCNARDYHEGATADS